ncbi:unnamed protein product [Staurois parvus]|uniref:Uncharacterized protein n=1 Tax=Staurois parvus TaxID=386267 RepID=A0ABN9BG95_9NEOB|nr:unnamed protein product [Staurois parvus]
MAVLCTAIHSSVPELTGRKIVCKQNLPLRWRCSVLTEHQWVITGRDPVIDIRGPQMAARGSLPETAKSLIYT